MNTALRQMVSLEKDFSEAQKRIRNLELERDALQRENAALREAVDAAIASAVEVTGFGYMVSYHIVSDLHRALKDANTAVEGEGE
jgi:uncharacterized protein YhaN